MRRRFRFSRFLLLPWLRRQLSCPRLRRSPPRRLHVWLLRRQVRSTWYAMIFLLSLPLLPEHEPMPCTATEMQHTVMGCRSEGGGRAARTSLQGRRRRRRPVIRTVSLSSSRARHAISLPRHGGRSATHCAGDQPVRARRVGPKERKRSLATKTSHPHQKQRSCAKTSHPQRTSLAIHDKLAIHTL